MDKQTIISKTSEYVRSKLEGEGSGHDWWHITRVWSTAKSIGEKEKADMFVVELAALLHDISDWKFNNGDETVGSKIAGEWLESLGVENEIIEHVKEIIMDLSFKGAGTKSKISTIEGEIVQDADRLDAIGAIGIARCFAYGGSKGSEIYNPEIKHTMHKTAEEYKSNNSTSVNHFYEKLLLLKGLMNTRTAKDIAKERHNYMEGFLKRFFEEWEGK